MKSPSATATTKGDNQNGHTGPLSKALRQREDKHLAPGLQNFALLTALQ
jgi:hypothetical protein